MLQIFYIYKPKGSVVGNTELRSITHNLHPGKQTEFDKLGYELKMNLFCFFCLEYHLVEDGMVCHGNNIVMCNHGYFS